MKTALRLITIFTLASALAVHAQDKPRDEAYKLSFAIYEMEDGKKINQRDYIMMARSNTGRAANMRVGTRVPVTVEDKKMQYLDVGLELRCSLEEPASGKLQATFEISLSSFALPEQGANPGSGNPILRNTSMNVYTYPALGKPTVIASLDDVGSKKRTIIEVTTTKIE